MVYSSERKRIYLSSAQADVYPEGKDEHAVVEFSLSEDITSDGMKAVWVRVVSACIPNTIYNVPSNKNTIAIATGGGAPTVYTLAVRNYTVAELIVALDAALAPVNVTVTHNSNLARLTFAKSTAGDATLVYEASGLANIIGMAGDNVIIPGSGSVTMPRAIDLAGARSILISSPNLQTHSLDSATQAASRPYVIASVPLTVTFGSLQSYTNPSDMLLHTVTRHVKDLRMELYDENFERVYLSGSRWSVVLEVDVV